MYQKPTVPRSIGGVIDDAVQLYKAAFSACILPSFVVSLIAGALSYYMVSSMPMTVGRGASADILARYKGMGVTFGLIEVVVLLASLLFYGMIILNTAAVGRGERPGFAQSLSRTLGRLPALVGATLLMALIFVLIFCPLIIVRYYTSSPLQAAGEIFLGFCVLLIPAVYFWNRLQLYMVPLLIDSTGPLASLGVSWRLVGNNWWRTATVIFVLFVILFVLEIVLGMLSGLFALFGGGGITTDPTQLMGRVAMASLLIGTIVRTFTVPLVFAAFVALYQDLLLRKEGGDLEARLGALPGG